MVIGRRVRRARAPFPLLPGARELIEGQFREPARLFGVPFADCHRREITEDDRPLLCGVFGEVVQDFLQGLPGG
jgi:hypothetical protein